VLNEGLYVLKEIVYIGSTGGWYWIVAAVFLKKGTIILLESVVSESVITITSISKSKVESSYSFVFSVITNTVENLGFGVFRVVL
jgi:hypothetical protein